MSKKVCRYFDEGRWSCPAGGNWFYKHVYPDGCRQEPQRQKVGISSRYWAQRRSHFWELSDNDDDDDDDDDNEEMVFMFWAPGGDIVELTDFEGKWDSFPEEFYDLDL